METIYSVIAVAMLVMAFSLFGMWNTLKGLMVIFMLTMLWTLNMVGDVLAMYVAGNVCVAVLVIFSLLNDSRKGRLRTSRALIIMLSPYLPIWAILNKNWDWTNNTSIIGRTMTVMFSLGVILPNYTMFLMITSNSSLWLEEPLNAKAPVRF